MKTPKHIATIAVASFGLALTASPALATTHEVQTQDVSTAGLDLNTPEGQRLLDKRIERAAREVCGADDIRTGTRIPHYTTNACIAKAKASAKRQVAAIMADRQRGG